MIVTEKFAGTAPVSTVSVGTAGPRTDNYSRSRQAVLPDSTDAVNGSPVDTVQTSIN